MLSNICFVGGCAAILAGLVCVALTGFGPMDRRKRFGSAVPVCIGIAILCIFAAAMLAGRPGLQFSGQAY